MTFSYRKSITDFANPVFTMLDIYFFFTNYTLFDLLSFSHNKDYTIFCKKRSLNFSNTIYILKHMLKSI